MTIGWKQFAGRCKQGGLALLWAFIYDPITARIVNFYRHPKLWRRRLLRTTIVAGVALVFFFGVIPSLAYGGVGGWAASALGYILSIIVGLLSSILSLLGWIFNGVVYNWEWFQRIVTFPAVEEGWTAVRDVANLSFVLILLGIGFATILRVPTYHIKRLILPFVVALLLINFSKLICGVVLDFCRVLMASFAQSMVENSSGGNYSGVIAKAIGVKSFFDFPEVTDITHGHAYLQSVLAVFVFMIALCFAFLMLIALLISRWVSLMVLTIFSPLAYAGMILPSTQKMVKSWWTSFMQKAFYGPAAVFMVWLAISVLMTLTLQEDEITRGEGGYSNFSLSGFISIGPETFLIMLIAVIILLKAVTISKSMGIAGANGVINAGSGLAKQAGKGAWRGTKALTRGTFGRIPLGKGRKLSDVPSMARKQLSRLGGTAGRAKDDKARAELESQSEKFGNLKELTDKQIDKKAKSGRSADRVAALKEKARRGNFKNRQEAQQAENWLRSNGSVESLATFKDNLAKSNLGLAYDLGTPQGEADAAKFIRSNDLKDMKMNRSDTASMVRKYASDKQKQNLNEQQKSDYVNQTNNSLATATVGSADRKQMVRDAAVLSGNLNHSNVSNTDLQEFFKGGSAKDIASLDPAAITGSVEAELATYVKNDPDSVSKAAMIARNNPELAAKMKQQALSKGGKPSVKSKWRSNTILAGL